MTTERDIAALSVPFVSGVALASVLPVSGLEWVWPCLAASAGVMAPAILLLRGHYRPLWPCAALFFLLGIFCFGSCTLGEGLSPAPSSPAASDALAALIDGTPFKCRHTAGLLKALLLGRRQGVPGEVIGYFRASGASHLLALSGLHLGVLYGILCRLSAPLGGGTAAKAFRFCATAVAGAFYVRMTGASESIVRAFIFIVARETVRLLPGRKLSSRAVLCLAVTLQLALSPHSISSPGFQLSYLAMAGIITVFPVLQGWYPGNGSGPVRKIWDTMAASISCQLFTGPLVWLRFRSFPKYFLLTNILALPLSEALIVCGAALLAARAAGWCPELLVYATDTAARLLVACLETVSKM